MGEGLIGGEGLKERGGLGTAHYVLHRVDLGETGGGGALIFLKPERGVLRKYRETKEGGGGFEKIYWFEKTLVVLKMYHKTT